MKHTDPSEADFSPPGLSIYVHWPFCESKCPYCDFNSHVAGRIDHEDWRAAYLTELRSAAARLPGRQVETVFFGGGTPSLMQAETVSGILDEIDRLWGLDPGVEISLEANPGSVEAGRLGSFRMAGVNRISIGVQSLRDDDLRRLGRLHSAEDARRAIAIARERFDRVSIDLIYARQHQSVPDWTGELAEALAFGVDHLSLYQLTIEPGTVFDRRLAAGSLPGLPVEDVSADLYAITQDLCEAAGLPAYEVSNHARPGRECRHNLCYWQSGDYLGIGPGAHGRTTAGAIRIAEFSPRDPADWLARVRSEGKAIEQTPLTAEEHAAEHLLMGLRLASGLNLSLHERVRGRELSRAKIEELVALGFLDSSGQVLRVTPAGRLLLNPIIAALDDASR